MYSFRDVFNLVCRHNNPATYVHFWPPYQFRVNWFPVTDWKVLSFHLSIFCLFLSLSQCPRKLIVYWISHQYHYTTLPLSHKHSTLHLHIFMTSCGYTVELLVTAKHILYYSCCLSSYFDFFKYFIYFADVFFPLSVRFPWLKVEPQNCYFIIVTDLVFFVVVNNIGPFNIHCSSLNSNWQGGRGWGGRGGSLV